MRADRADPDISSLRSRVLPCLLPPIDCLGATTLSELSLRYGRKLSLLLSLSLSLSLAGAFDLRAGRAAIMRREFNTAAIKSLSILEIKSDGGETLKRELEQ